MEPVRHSASLDANLEGVAQAVDAFVADFPPVACLRFELQALEAIELPAYTGSAWRGVLGHALRRSACVTRRPTCDGCLLVSQCVYSTLFESPPVDQSVAMRHKAAPHPYVLAAEPGTPQRIAEGVAFHLDVRLIGPAVRALPYLIHAMSVAGERGLGRERGRFQLRRVTRRTAGMSAWSTVHEPPGELSLPDATQFRLTVSGRAKSEVDVRLETPLRMKRRGHLVGPAEFTVGDFVHQLVWRLSDLSRHYSEHRSVLAWEAVEQAVNLLRVSALEVRWRDWTRFSSRQGAKMQLGGVVGSFRLGGEGLGALWPLLWVAQWVHVGKATSMGLGRFDLS